MYSRMVTKSMTSPSRIAIVGGGPGRSLAAQFEGWAPEILSLVHDGGDTITPRLLYTLPAGHKWTASAA